MTAGQYILSNDHAENRLVIHYASQYRGAFVDSTFADSWLDAKQKLGFDLTPAQQWLLDRQKRRAA